MAEQSIQRCERRKQAQIICGPKQSFSDSNLSRLQVSNEDRKIPVVSVIGTQGTGKSTLLNQCFGTNLRTFHSTKIKKTTDGVWLCACDDLFLLDFEGSDSQQGTSEIENRLALFAFYVSDVVLINITARDLGRRFISLEEMLKTVLSTGLKTGKLSSNRVLLIALLRDPPYFTENNFQDQSAGLRNQAYKFFEKTWNSVDQNTDSRSFNDVFQFESFPLRYDSAQDRLQEDDLQSLKTYIKAHKTEFQTNYHWICRQWKEAWEEIRTNKTLDTPDFRQREERSRLEAAYEEMKPGLLKPWEEKVERLEPINIEEVLEKAKNQVLEGLGGVINRLRFKVQGRLHINSYITNDLTAIMSKWEESYAPLTRDKISALLEEIATFVSFLCDKKKRNDTFAASIRGIRAHFAELGTFSAFATLQEEMKGSIAQLLDKKTFLQTLRRIFFIEEDPRLLQISREDLTCRLTYYAELYQMMHEEGSFPDFSKEMLSEYDLHYQKVNQICVKQKAREEQEKERKKNELKNEFFQQALKEVIRTEPDYKVEAFTLTERVEADTGPGILSIFLLTRMETSTKGSVVFRVPQGYTVIECLVLNRKYEGIRVEWGAQRLTDTSISVDFTLYHPYTEFGNSFVEVTVTGHWQKKIGEKVIKRTPQEAMAFAEMQVKKFT